MAKTDIWRLKIRFSNTPLLQHSITPLIRYAKYLFSTRVANGATLNCTDVLWLLRKSVMENVVFGFTPQQIINLVLNLISFFTLQPFIPII